MKDKKSNYKKIAKILEIFISDNDDTIMTKDLIQKHSELLNKKELEELIEFINNETKNDI